MATINYDYSENEDLYNSGSIEEELLSIYKEGKFPSISDNNAFFYTMTPIRENIINWYPFKENSTILEVGGGLGSITGALCKNSKKVVSCEYSKRRAENIFYRHKDKENLEVIVGNLNKVKFSEKFDYIVLIGVYEYAKRFCKTENPFHDFLNNLKKLLKSNGVILIAIENRYGIKYFAGATEDHYNTQYLGLKGYEDYDIETLGKHQLSKIISECGFNFCKYYYPYPDYKMPYIIYTDNRLPLRTEVNSLYFYNHGKQVYSFDYRDVIPGIVENNQYGFFANSFLVEITNDQKSLSNISYAKTSLVRTNEYQIYTIIKDNNNILKYAKTKEAVKHLDELIVVNNQLKKLGLNVPDILKVNDEYQIENIDGITLCEYILDLTIKKEKKKIIKEIENYYQLLKKISYKGKIKKYLTVNEKEYYNDKYIDILKVSLTDLHPSNIIKNNDKYYVIDQEWLSEYDIPLKYMLYFSINYLFLWVKNFDKLFSKSELLEKYNISEEEVNIYIEMSNYYAKSEKKTIDDLTNKIILNENVFVDEIYEKEKYFIENKQLYDSYNLLNEKYNDIINCKSYKIIFFIRKLQARLGIKKEK